MAPAAYVLEKVVGHAVAGHDQILQAVAVPVDDHRIAVAPVVFLRPLDAAVRAGHELDRRTGGFERPPPAPDGSLVAALVFKQEDFIAGIADNQVEIAVVVPVGCHGNGQRPRVQRRVELVEEGRLAQPDRLPGTGNVFAEPDKALLAAEEQVRIAVAVPVENLDAGEHADDVQVHPVEGFDAPPRRKMRVLFCTDIPAEKEFREVGGGDDVAPAVGIPVDREKEPFPRQGGVGVAMLAAEEDRLVHFQLHRVLRVEERPGPGSNVWKHPGAELQVGQAVAVEIVHPALGLLFRGVAFERNRVHGGDDRLAAAHPELPPLLDFPAAQDKVRLPVAVEVGNVEQGVSIDRGLEGRTAFIDQLPRREGAAEVFKIVEAVSQVPRARHFRGSDIGPEVQVAVAVRVERLERSADAERKAVGVALQPQLQAIAVSNHWNGFREGGGIRGCRVVVEGVGRRIRSFAAPGDGTG